MTIMVTITIMVVVIIVTVMVMIAKTIASSVVPAEPVIILAMVMTRSPKSPSILESRSRHFDDFRSI